MPFEPSRIVRGKRRLYLGVKKHLDPAYIIYIINNTRRIRLQMTIRTLLLLLHLFFLLSLIIKER